MQVNLCAKCNKMLAISPEGLCNICDEQTLQKRTKMAKKITDAQRELLIEAREYCDEHDKSTEFMLQYMQDVANVNLDQVIQFLTEEGG